MAGPILDDSGIASIQDIQEARDADRSGGGQHRLGQLAHLDDGRRFAYARTDAGTFVKGNLLIGPVVEVNHGDLAVGNAVGAGVTSIPAGTITFGATAAAQNLYREGYLYVTDGPDEGAVYRVREHAAVASAGTNNELVLFDSIREAWTAATTVTFLKNSYDGPAASATLGNPAGVSLVDAAAGEFAWLQLEGNAPVLIDGTPAISTPVIQSNAVAGAVEVAAVITTALVGVMVTTGVDTEHQIVDLSVRGA